MQERVGLPGGPRSGKAFPEMRKHRLAYGVFRAAQTEIRETTSPLPPPPPPHTQRLFLMDAYHHCDSVVQVWGLVRKF